MPFATPWPAAVALVVAAAAPAGAATPHAEPEGAEQHVAVVVPTVQTDEFVWSVPGGGFVDLTDPQIQGQYLEFTGELRPVVVSDDRVGGPPWSVSGRVDQVSQPLSARQFGWRPTIVDGAEAATAGPAVAAAAPDGPDIQLGLAQPSLLASAIAGHTLRIVVVGAELTIRAPADTPAGTYSAVLTLTALT